MLYFATSNHKRQSDMKDYLLKSAIELGILKALVKVEQIPATMSRKEAYERYGKENVKRWVKNNLLECIKMPKTPISFPRVRLELLAKSFS